MLFSKVLLVSLLMAAADGFVSTHGSLTPRRNAPVVRGIDINAMDYVWDRQDPEISLPDGVTEQSDPVPFRITPEQIDTLKRDGVVHIKGVLTPEWLEHLRALTDHQVKHPHVWASPGVASGLYDYVQRNVWTTNDGFMKFLYHSPVSSVLAGLGEAKSSVRLTTDLLMVNPNKGFKWHQDNQNGPIGFEDALRWWVTMDDTPRDYGAPVYLRRSHENESVDEDAVFVSLDEGDLPEYGEMLEFRPKAGDMIVWNARTIHKIDGPQTQDWGQRKRRVLGGTVAVDDATYKDKQKVEFADMGRHFLKDGDSLNDPHFPRIWPRPVPEERAARFQGRVGRSLPGFARMVGAMFSFKTMQQFSSWGNVVKIEKAGVDNDEEEEETSSSGAAGIAQPARSR